MADVGIILLGGGIGLLVYTYILYPFFLGVLGAGKERPSPPSDPDVWPSVSISLPVYNEDHQIAETLESLLSLDYPRDRLQIMVISDGSTDRTDQIVQAYGDRGVELLRLPERKGKGAAEAAASPHLTGEIVVNTDASVRIVPDRLKPLIRQFSDHEVGLASGRNIRVTSGAGNASSGVSRQLGYETAVRNLETRAGSIVGPSTFFYAIRSHLHRVPLPISLSRDFAAALHCRERGYRAVSVPDAIGYGPRASSLRREYARKVLTVTHGLRTLLHKRNLMNPLRYGLFAWMLFSHRVCRWLVPWAAAVAIVGLALAAPSMPWARVGLLAIAAGVLLGWMGWRLSDRQDVPRILALPAFGLMGNVAAMHGLVRVISSKGLGEPTVNR